MRLLVLLSIVAVAGLPAAAQAQLPAPPPLPVPTPTVPALPPLPVPPPTAPTVPTVPTVPPAPAPVPSVPSTPAPSSAPSAPATGSGTAPSSSGSTSGSSGTAGVAEGSGAGTQRAGARKRPTVTLPFRVASTGRVRIPLTQIAPRCRAAGALLFDARRGANRFRFNGRVGRRPLPDGTYVASTPSGDVRFAIVDGKPTLNAARLDESVCPPPEPLDDGLRSEVVGGGSSPSGSPPAGGASGGGGEDDGLAQLPLPQVLGTSLTEAAEAATSLHPAFYVLLALAIAALAAATLPARTMPAAAAGAALSRRRAELTLAGTVSLLTVIVAYWVTLL